MIRPFVRPLRSNSTKSRAPRNSPIQEAETEERRAELTTAFKNGSVVSWQHINLHGEYDFSDEKLRDSVGLNLPEILGFRQGEKREGKNTRKSNDTNEL